MIPQIMRQSVNLSPGDLFALSESPAKSGNERKKIRDTHHAIARCLARGDSVGDAAVLTGYSPATIYSLQGTQTFRDLVAYYQEREREVVLSVMSRLENLGLDMLGEIQERLETDPGQFSLRDLRETAKLALDRAGYGPSKNTNVTISGISNEDLRRIKSSIPSNEGVEIVEDLSYEIVPHKEQS